MRQKTLADSGFEMYRKKTREEQFLDEMEQIIPWDELSDSDRTLLSQAEGSWTTSGQLGTNAARIHYFLQHWFELSDPGAEEALYDSHDMRNFVGINLGREPVPDETTICKLHHLS